MKGDFSRQTFAAKKHYSGVLMQQGRVQLDADWNEQGAITRYRTETEAVDVIGRCGAPIHEAGFEITTDGKTLFIGPGRYYLDGLLAENDADKNISYEDQAELDLPGADLSAVLAEMADKKLTNALVYLDVWERHITALDDRLLREVALGGPDTTTRMKTVWQVKVLPIARAGGEELAKLREQAKQLQADLESLAKLTQDLQAEQEKVKQQMGRVGPTSPEFKQLQKLLKQLTARLDTAGQKTAQVKADLETVLSKIAELSAATGVLTCDDQFPEWRALFDKGGTLNALSKHADSNKNPCLAPASVGYRRLENQLYRVEIHRGGTLGKASFKWSRDNGTVVTAIEGIVGSIITVHDVGPDDALGFAHGQWVELTDDALDLNGLPGQLAQIDTVNAATREITLQGVTPKPLAATTSGIDPARHPKLRRWDQIDQTGAPVTDQGIETAAGWLPLEDGISVQFSAGQYRTGDYWLIPARTATEEIEWPPFEVPNLNPQPQPRLGIEHHYCRLALIRVQDGAVDKDITDCRKFFPPLTELTPAGRKPALHVVKTNWENDSPLDLETLAEAGLRITLDGPPDPASVSNATVIVTIEIPYVSDGTANPTARQAAIPYGQVGVDPADANTITWRYVEPNVGGGNIAVGPAVGHIDMPFARAAAVPQDSLLLRVTLKGHVIWRNAGNQRRFLDGQAFGRPVVDANNQVHTALIFPSGDGARASDFESWFYSGVQQQQTPLQVQTVTFKSVFAGVGEQISSAGVITFPRDPAQPVEFKAGEQMNVIDVTFNRDVQPEGVFKIGDPQGLLFEFTSANRSLVRRSGQLEVTNNLARFIAQEPSIWEEPGEYRLTVFGNDANTGPAFRAADDNTQLDGNFDNQPGGDLVLLVKAL